MDQLPPNQPPPYLNIHQEWRSPTQPNITGREYTFLPSPSHFYDTIETTPKSHMGPRSVPLPQTVSARNNRLPSVMSE